jgi:hypothetical protein
MSGLPQLGTAALSWAHRGWFVFPLARGSKKPLIPKEDGGRGHLDATRDEAQIVKWWTDYPNANIGGACGSSGRNVLDADKKHGGLDQLNRLMLEIGPEQFATQRHRTPGGGLHLVFNDSDGRTKNSESVIAVGIDTRGYDGYIVLAPSVVDGKRYVVETAEDMSLLPFPAVLREMLVPNGDASGRKHIPGVDDDERIALGQRHSVMRSFAARLRYGGLNGSKIYIALCTLSDTQCDPPHTEKERQEELLPLASWAETLATGREALDAADETEHRVSDDRKPQLVSDVESDPTSVKWILESTAAIARRGIEPAQWDIQDLLPEEDGPAILYGQPGTLKSWIGLHACDCAVSERKFLGRFAVKQRPSAVFVNLDAGKRSFERRTLRFSPSERLKIVSPESYDARALEEVFATNPGAFIVIDTLADIYQIKRGDDPAESMRNFLRREIRRMYQKYNSNGFILDHPHRPQGGEPFGDYYGSQQKEAAIRVMWWVTPLASDETNVARAKITCRKLSEDEKFEPFIVRINFTADRVALTYEGKLDQPSGSTVQGPTDIERCLQVVQGVPGGMTTQALAELTGLTEERVRKAVKTRQFKTTGKGRSTRHHPQGSEND